MDWKRWIGGTVIVIACTACSHAKPSSMPPSMPPVPLPAPQLIAPPEGAVLTFFPRNIDFEWTPVNGAVRYVIEVDCYRCCAAGRWCSDVGPNRTTRSEVTGTTFTSNGFPGDQPGRWRVWALDPRERVGLVSPWREFTFHTERPPRPTPTSFRTPAGETIGGPGVSGPRAIYSPNPSYTDSARKDRIAGIVGMEAIVDENGRVQNVSVLRPLRGDLDEAAVATFRQWRFEPARRDGRPMAAVINVEMMFSLK